MGFTGSDIGLQNNLHQNYTQMDTIRRFHPFVERILRVIWRTRTMEFFWTEVVDITKFVEIRYQLLPYTMFWQYVTDGIPLLKPLVYFDQEEMQTHYRTDGYIWKSNFSLSNSRANSVGRRMYLPKGNWWYKFWTNRLVSGQVMGCNFDFDQILLKKVQ
jgi:alpha-glucosidase